MAQKPLKKSGKPAAKKAVATNKHGKAGGVTKKGRLSIAPTRKRLQADHKESKKLTKGIDAINEEHFAGMAAKAGSRLSLLKAPVLATAQERGAAKKAPVAK